VNLRPPVPEKEGDIGAAFDSPDDPQRKAKPEAEALIVIQKERAGKLHILSSAPTRSEGWFISHTAILNSLCGDGSRITWSPESFLRFTEGLATGAASSEPARADRMFETLLWSVAQSGLSLLDQNTVDAVFGSGGDQCVLNISQQRDQYARLLESKYGAAPDKVLEKVPRADQPLAALQLANELAQAEKTRADSAARESGELRKRLKQADRDLARLSRYRKKAAEKAAKGKRKARKQSGKPKHKNRRQ
jgi:hypothetical protein